MNRSAYQSKLACRSHREKARLTRGGHRLRHDLVPKLHCRHVFSKTVHVSLSGIGAPAVRSASLAALRLTNIGTISRRRGLEDRRAPGTMNRDIAIELRDPIQDLRRDHRDR